MRDDCGDTLSAAPTGDTRPWSPHVREVNPLTATPAEPFSCLTEVELFADLSPAEIAAMDLMTPAHLFRAGEFVFSQSQPVTALFILKSGRVRVFRVTEDGKALTMAILEPGAVFGEMLLVGQRMYDNYAEAIEDAAQSGNWQPRTSKLCDWCDHRALCPAWGGTPPPLPEHASILALDPHASAAQMPALD